MIMKKGLLFIVVLFSFVGTWSQVVFKNDEVTVSKLKDKTWVFETWDFTTMYLLEGNDKAALIDAGTRCADLDKIVESITNKPYDVIITHAHPDHAGWKRRYYQAAREYPRHIRPSPAFCRLGEDRKARRPCELSSVFSPFPWPEHTRAA